MKFFTIGVNELEKYVNKSNTELIDLRSKEEYNQQHIENAQNIPYDQLEKHVEKLSKDMVYILYCQRGGSSLMAAKELSRQGYTIYTVIGGIRAWEEQKRNYRLPMKKY